MLVVFMGMKGSSLKVTMKGVSDDSVKNVIYCVYS